MNVKESVGIRNKPLEGRDQTGAVGAKAKAAGSPSGGGAAPSTDSVQISAKSREMAKASEALAATPMVRSEKVAAIKDRLANDQYQVEAEKVAHRMIVDYLGELV